jgi:glucose-6-phosphate 1-dehydrogenase
VVEAMSAGAGVEVETAENPLRQGSVTLRAAEPCTFVVFGASGDLAHRKLLPALLQLSRQRLLHPKTAVIGFARREMTDDEFRNEIGAAARERGVPDAEWRRFAENLFYRAGVFENGKDYAGLRSFLDELEKKRGVPGNRIYYMAVPPSALPTIFANLDSQGLARRKERAWTRVIVEKPFGHDLASARELNAKIHECFEERQVFRIDHYLGKETVQNILILRLANGIFEPLWNNRYVDHVQITVAETIGIEGRAGYYEQAGALRDILQNHMLQLLTLTAMEPPARFEADSVRDEKAKVLRTIEPLAAEKVARSTVRGQYAAGSVAGEPAHAYKEEPGVAPGSTTETFLALRLEIDNWRWAGTPFYLRTGKRLAKRATEIAIVYRRPPYSLFRSMGCNERIESNVLRLRIQPDEGTSFSFGAKAPGWEMRIQPVRMDFNYLTAFGAEPPEAYERLLLDCNLGDSTLFAREDEVELAWERVDAIASAWQKTAQPPLLPYPAGSFGPKEADDLLARDGRQWFRV